MIGGTALLSLHSLDKILSIVHPEISWNFPNKSPSHKKSQHLLKSMLKIMFPHHGIKKPLKIN